VTYLPSAARKKCHFWKAGAARIAKIPFSEDGEARQGNFPDLMETMYRTAFKNQGNPKGKHKGRLASL